MTTSLRSLKFRIRILFARTTVSLKEFEWSDNLIKFTGAGGINWQEILRFERSSDIKVEDCF